MDDFVFDLRHEIKLDEIGDEGVDRESNISNEYLNGIIIIPIKLLGISPACLFALVVHSEEVVINICDDNACTRTFQAIDEREDYPHDELAFTVGIMISDESRC